MFPVKMFKVQAAAPYVTIGQCSAWIIVALSALLIAPLLHNVFVADILSFLVTIKRRRRRFRIDIQARYVGAHPLYRPLSRRGLFYPIKLAYDPCCRESRLLAAMP